MVSKAMFKQQKLSFLSLALISLAILPQAVLSQTYNPGQKPHIDPSGEFATQSFTSPPSLPDFPQYTGQAVLLSGTIFPNAGGGASYTMVLAAKEDPQMIRSWYEEALKGLKWGQDKANSQGNKLSGWKNGNWCQVCIQPPSRPGDGANILINYRKAQKSRYSNDD